MSYKGYEGAEARAIPSLSPQLICRTACESQTEKMNIKQYPLDAAAVGAALPQLDMTRMADEHGMEKRTDLGSSAEDHEGDVPDLKEKTTVAPTDERVQAGVEQAAAITQTWTKNSLRMAYLLYVAA